VHESFTDPNLLDHPHYTRPEVFREWPTPPVLLSGNHQAIAAWRHQQAIERTQERRPDLLPPTDND
jgi:tRNA (guanine37-N1)-methyltransferase